MKGIPTHLNTKFDYEYIRKNFPKEQYIPFYVGKHYAYIKTLDVVEDIDPALSSQGEGRENLTLDTFTGSSVSTNNIIRMLNALYEYHATDSYFNK